jgi:hypothetical protein
MKKTEQITRIEAFLRAMYPEEDAIIEVIGIRCLTIDRFLSRDKHRCATAAWQLSERKESNVYWLTSPVDPDSNYALQVNDTTVIHDTYVRATEKAIARRKHIVIDLDPHRPPGTAATDDQRRNADDAATHVICNLVLGHCWPYPTIINSGNGVQLIFNCDLPTRYSAYKTLLGALAPEVAERYGVVIDCSVSQPAQLARMPWTLNRKAGRRATIEAEPYPEQVYPVTEEMITETLDALGVRSHQFDLRTAEEKWVPALDADGVQKLIDSYPDILVLAGTEEGDDLTKFFLAECPFAGRRHRGDGRKTVIAVGEDQFWFRCWSDDCAHHGIKDLRQLLSDTGRQPPPFWVPPVDDEDLWDGVIDAYPEYTVDDNRTPEEDCNDD